jgi:hypothetical protein
MSNRYSPRRGLRLLLVALAASPVAACAERGGASGGPGAEEEELRREVEDLRRLVHRAERVGLVPSEGLVVAVGESLARQLVQLTLPREQVVEGGFRVRLDRAEVRFRDGYGALELDGQVSGAEDASVSVDLTVQAKTGTVALDAGAGTLTVQVVPTAFEIHRVAMGEEDSGTRAFAEGVARALAGALTGLAAPFTIPIAFEREVRLGQLEAGPVRAPAASVPLKIAVRDVSAHGGRLWIVLRVEAGRWTKDDDR